MELYDLLLSEKPSEQLASHEEELFTLIPELSTCKGFNQNNEWHIYDVYEHILHVVDNVPSNIVMRLTALFHDIGKPSSYIEDDNKVGHFYGHWEVSQRVFDSFASKYNIDHDISERVSNLIYYHDINVSKLSETELKEMFHKLNYDGIEELYIFKRADLLAQNEKYHYILDEYTKQKEEILNKLKKFNS